MNAEMQHYVSLDEISNSLNEDAFAKAIHLESISTSQISRRFREDSTGCMYHIRAILTNRNSSLSHLTAQER
jgi:hypothetical protein